MDGADAQPVNEQAFMLIKGSGRLKERSLIVAWILNKGNILKNLGCTSVHEADLIGKPTHALLLRSVHPGALPDDIAEPVGRYHTNRDEVKFDSFSCHGTKQGMHAAVGPEDGCRTLDTQG